MRLNPAIARELRNKAGLSMEELACRAGVGLGTVSNIEKGTYKSARSDVIEKLAAALQVDWRVFFADNLQEVESQEQPA